MYKNYLKRPFDLFLSTLAITKSWFINGKQSNYYLSNRRRKSKNWNSFWKWNCLAELGTNIWIVSKTQKCCSKAYKKYFIDGELEEKLVCANFAQTTQHWKPGRVEVLKVIKFNIQRYFFSKPFLHQASWKNRGG